MTQPQTVPYCTQNRNGHMLTDDAYTLLLCEQPIHPVKLKHIPYMSKVTMFSPRIIQQLLHYYQFRVVGLETASIGMVVWDTLT